VIALDTNVLVRLIARDDAAAADAATALVTECYERLDPILVSPVAVVEACWVLTQSYGMSRADVAERLSWLLCSLPFQLWAPDATDALDAWGAGGVEIADRILLCHASGQGATLMTFDKRLAKLEGAQLVERSVTGLGTG